MRHSVAAVLVTLAALSPTADAAPQNTRITAVYQTSKCASSTCHPGDPKLSNGAVVTGTIQVDVASQDAVGFSSVRLEAIGRGESGYKCISLWYGPANNFTSSASWNTTNWPYPGPSNGCDEKFPHNHGAPAANGSYSMHVVAIEATSGEQGISSEFSVRLANPSATPLWRGTPTVAGNAVTLRWYRNVETDVIEYRVNRTDSKGKKVISLSAASPTSTPGCQPEVETTFTCVDHPAGGTVRYTIQAFRPTPASAPNCKTRSTPCIGSAPNATKTVTVKKTGGGTTTSPPPASQTPTPRASPTTPATSTAPPSSVDSTDGSPNARPVVFPTSVGTPNRKLPIALASLALAGLGVAVIVRARRRSPR